MSKRSPSFEKINYSLRPGKAVERRMICYALRKLESFGSLSEYQYIGFGSTFFYDFILLHKELGIYHLTSIEGESAKEDRFHFNKPFHCIDLRIGHSNETLPEIDWSRRTVLWLDYDSKLLEDQFQDISTFFTEAQPGSVFLMTINCQGSAYGKDNEDCLLNLAASLGEDRIPLESKLSKFSGSELPKTLKEIVENEIHSILNELNGVLASKEKIEYIPLFYFIYRDGAKMMTIGGIVVNPETKQFFDQANFFELDFIYDDGTPFRIVVPNITLKEIRFLNSQLPNGIDNNGNFVDNELVDTLKPMIPSRDILNYKRIYKFFPVFSETFLT
ncbi:MAG: O-methyltransferase [Bacteroidota bacterium]